MAKKIEGNGRVSVFPLTHMWEPRRICIMAYTSTGDFGKTAVVGYIPFPEIPDVSLMDMAARHAPSRLYGSSGPDGFAEACWLINTGSASRLVRSPGDLHLEHVDWSLEVDSSTELGKIMYSSSSLVAGRFRFKDEDLMRRAKDLIPADQFVPGN